MDVWVTSFRYFPFTFVHLKTKFMIRHYLLLSNYSVRRVVVVVVKLVFFQAVVVKSVHLKRVKNFSSFWSKSVLLKVLSKGPCSTQFVFLCQ